MKKRSLFQITMVICFMISVMFLGQISAFADEVRPIHEYKFDKDSGKTVVDTGSVTKNGVSYNTDNGKLVVGYNGKGKARYFDGGDDRINFSDHIIPLGAKSVRFKFKKDASTINNTGKYEAIFSTLNMHSGGWNDGFYMEVLSNGGNILVGVENASSFTFSVVSGKICDGQWHDILFTYNGTAKLYVDDMKMPFDRALAAKKESEQTNLCIGAANEKNGHFTHFNGYLDNIQIYDSAITPNSTTTGETSNTSNLKATGGDSEVDLTWDAVTDTTSYTIKRSTTAGGPYTTIATDIKDTTYTDTDVTNGTAYYYVVTAIADGRETGNSNEASATPTAGQTPPVDTKLKVVLEVYEALRLSVDDDLNVNTEMVWSSSDEAVATVNEKGIVTALAPGNTVITVKSTDGSYTDYINVLVVENAEDYRLAIDLNAGETARLTADDFTNTANITWAPMDSSIANVTIKGKVTALSKGLVLITAKDKDGKIIGKIYVRVRE